MFDKIDFSKMGDLLQQAQEQAKQMEEENEKKHFSAKSGGGLVKVTFSGKNEVVDIDIDDSLLDDKESMQILLISAFNDALKMVEDNKKLIATKMMSQLGGFGNFTK